MNRGKFTGLIFMMVFSILGITWVQVIWIKKAIGIRNENFDYYARYAIREAADAIESSRKMDNLFSDFLMPGISNFTDTTKDISSYLRVGSFSSVNGGNLRVRITNQSVIRNAGEAPVITVHDTTFTSDSSGSVTAIPDETGRIIITNNDVPAGGNSHGTYIRQEELIQWAKKRSDELRNMSDQMIAELYQWEKTMDVGKEEVEFALNRSLMFSPVQTPFEFAIIKNGKVADGNFKKAGKNDFLKSKYMERLFPDNIISQDMILSVIFPDRTNFVFGSMLWILGASLLFSLIILATFGFSLFLIINQKKISEMKSDFLNNMTHEFKTPIATISLAADTITNPKVINDESSVRHFIGMIKKENSRMDKKVETILQIASLDKREINFKFENLSLHALVEKAVDAVDIIVRQRNGKVDMKLLAQEPVVYGDNEHLFNLVNNLIDNAIKYSPENPEITIRTRNNETGIIMSVEDKGIGMSKSVQSKIFERFYRQSSGNIHDVKGFGLGLNYARTIVDAHRGSITVSSEQGKGSRFDVYLPFKPDN